MLELYGPLFVESYWVFVRDPNRALAHQEFLTYDTEDGIRELPAFTEPRGSAFLRLQSDPRQPFTLRVDGPGLWRRLLEIVDTKACQAAIDPGEPHGIRLSREMILGMVAEYGSTSASNDHRDQAL